MASLTPRQRAFAAAYASHGIAERAAVEAGYSVRTARGSTNRLLANAGVTAELARLAKAADDENIASLRELRGTWTRILRNEDAPMRERLRASELLGKSLGAFVERIEHSGPQGAPLVNLTLTTKEAEHPELYGPGGRFIDTPD